MLRLIFMLFALQFCLGCGINVFKSAVQASSDRALIEEARVLIDQQDYEGALTTLNKVKHDSNDLRLLRTASRLGATGLSMWTIITNIIDSSGSNDKASSGADKIFDELTSSVLGTGESKTLRITALTSSLEDLNAAPEASAKRVRNMACFLAGILTVPTASDAMTAINAIGSQLNSLANAVDISNPNAQCPDLSNLNRSLATISTLQSQFMSIFASIEGCRLLDIRGQGSELNAIESQLAKFNAKADIGCSTTPACGSSEACKALGLSCVYDALTTGSATAVAGDGIISSCELVQNCLDPTQCF
jgi:hypothetical protein